MSTDSLRLSKAAFDTMAADYDAAFTQTRLGRWLRARVWSHLESTLPASGRILEIGCGTGEDALQLARKGYEVVATDASSEMLAVARSKARLMGCESRIDFRHIPMETLSSELEAEAFDAVFSNFGVLNCTSNLPLLVQQLAGLMKPGAPLVCVIMGRHVPWEWAWFLARLDVRRAFRRLPREGTLWRGMRIHYPSPRTFRRAIEPGFEPGRFSPLGLVLPPSYASFWLEKRATVFNMLARIENVAHGCQSLSGLADHYIVEARRKVVDTNA